MVGKMVFRERILTSLSLEEVAAGSYRHIPTNSKRVYRGGVLNPSQATTYARSNFELPCGELLLEGALFLWRSPSPSWTCCYECSGQSHVQ
jgi:hypothetical protein